MADTPTPPARYASSRVTGSTGAAEADQAALYRRRRAVLKEEANHLTPPGLSRGADAWLHPSQQALQAVLCYEALCVGKQLWFRPSNGPQDADRVYF